LNYLEEKEKKFSTAFLEKFGMGIDTFAFWFKPIKNSKMKRNPIN
jgi:hypothetical protein